MQRSSHDYLYNDKNKTYYTLARTDILPLIPKIKQARVLEIGCGCGNTLQYLKTLDRCAWTCGVELDPWAATQARQHLDLVFEGDIEHIELPLQENSLDLILCLDVLEHLVDPWEVIRKLTGLLKPEGCIIACIPNIRHFSILFDLILKGKWDYSETGLLDKTHLRFFVRKTAISLLESSGLKVDSILALKGTKAWLVNVITVSIFKDFLSRQFIIRATNEHN